MESVNEGKLADNVGKSIRKKIVEIISSSGSKQEIVSKLKKIDEKGGGTKWGDPGYMQRDIFNGLISLCLGAGPALLITSELGPIVLPVSVLGLYLTGVVFHMNAKNYDKFHLLEHYEDKINSKKKKLEAMKKVEKDPDILKDINSKISEANRCIKLIRAERRKLLPKPIQSKVTDDNLDDFDIDWSDWDDDMADFDISESVITESKKKKEDIFPVFMVTSYTDTAMGRMIKGWTGDKYTHASISFDTSLEKLYSFNGDSKFRGGISFESIKKYISYNPDADLRVSAFFLKKKDYNKLSQKLDDFVLHAKQTTYDFGNLLNIAFQRARETKDEYSLVCSQFVDVLLKFINVDLTNSPSNLVTPGMISRIDNPKVYLIFEGKAINYDKSKIDKIMNKLKKTTALPIKEAVSSIGFVIRPIFEEKVFPVEINDEGDILIRKKMNIDYLEEHSKSKRLYNTYKKNNNLYGMVYEADKLWYMNTLIMKEIETCRDEKKKEELITIRSKILNEFSLYLNEITKREPEFNFSKAYENSPFCDASVKITGSTVKGALNLLKTALKIL